MDYYRSGPHGAAAGADNHAERLEQAIRLLDSGDYSRATALLKNLATNGVAEAKLILGRIYWYGSGVETNRVRAAVLLIEACTEKSVQASFALRLIGVTDLLQTAVLADLRNDFVSAMAILSFLAESKIGSSQYQLATLFERLGNRREAVLLYAAAAFNGSEEAHAYLNFLEDSGAINHGEVDRAFATNQYIEKAVARNDRPSLRSRPRRRRRPR